jgi:hypothetical protein
MYRMLKYTEHLNFGSYMQAAGALSIKIGELVSPTLFTFLLLCNLLFQL